MHIFNTLYILYICILVKMKNDLKDRKIVPSSAVLYSEYIYRGKLRNTRGTPKTKFTAASSRIEGTGGLPTKDATVKTT